MVGIYKITSPSGRVYIGQSWGIQNRFKDYKRRPCPRQPKLNNSFIKYGVLSHMFEVVHELPIDVTQDILDRYEQIYLSQYKESSIEILNVREAGSRGKHSAESIQKMKDVQSQIPRQKPSLQTKIKMSLAQKGRISPMAGKKHSEESIKKMKDNSKIKNNWIGRKHSPESIEKMKAAKVGYDIKPENRFKNKGIESSEETRKKITEGLKKYWANKNKAA